MLAFAFHTVTELLPVSQFTLVTASEVLCSHCLPDLPWGHRN